MTERAAPFYCPYCGDEGLRPFDPADGTAGHGAWRCTACQRAFGLKYIGLTGGWVSTDDTDPARDPYTARTGVTS